jgi:hypothetical protein
MAYTVYMILNVVYVALIVGTLITDIFVRREIRSDLQRVKDLKNEIRWEERQMLRRIAKLERSGKER